MAEGLLEYEVRRLPDVLAAAVDDTSVTLLVQPTADADAVGAVVAAMLAAASLERTVTVLGGTSSADVRSRRLLPLVSGGLVGAGLLASAAAAAALTGGLPLLPAIDEPAPPTPAAAAPAPVPAAPTGTGRLIVPGGQPDWASGQPPIPLLPALPPAEEAPVGELAFAAAPTPAPKAARRTKPLVAAPEPLVPTAVATEPQFAPPPVVVPPVVVPPPAVVVAVPEIPALDTSTSGPKVDRPEHPDRPARPDVEEPADDDEAPSNDDSDGDPHKNDRGRGHHGHGNGRGRGHEDRGES